MATPSPRVLIDPPRNRQVYAALFIDAIVVKVHDGQVASRTSSFAASASAEASSFLLVTPSSVAVITAPLPPGRQAPRDQAGNTFKIHRSHGGVRGYRSGVSFATSGLQCLIWAIYAQQAILLITGAWACRRYVSLKRLRWLPISEVRQLLGFGGRVQIAALASSFNYELDILLVAFLFPVRYAGYYSIGANFAQQVDSMPINGLNPIVQDMGRSYGRSGKEGVLRSFPDTQRMWVTALGIFPAAAVLALAASSDGSSWPI
jgi:hypothetical protein